MCKTDNSSSSRIPEQVFTKPKLNLRCPLCKVALSNAMQAQDHIHQVHKGITATFSSDPRDPLEIELGLKNPGNDRLRTVAIMLESHAEDVVCLMLVYIMFNGAGPEVAVALYGIEGEPEYITVSTTSGNDWVGSPLGTNVDVKHAIKNNGTLMTTFSKNPTDFVQEGPNYKMSLKVNLGKLQSPQTAIRRQNGALNLFFH